MDEKTKFQLEEMIDAHGLADLLSSIAGLCAEKSDHIRAAYNDKPLAVRWNAAGVKIASCAANARVKEVSPT